MGAAALALGLLTVAPAAAQIEIPQLPPLLPLDPLTDPPAQQPPPGPPPAPATAGPPGAPSPGAPGAQCGPAPAVPKLKRSGPRNTSALVEAVAPLVNHGLSLQQAMILATAPFPVAGPATYTDDWKNPRMTPCPHLHEGTDIFAATGTPVLAIQPGIIKGVGRQAVGGLSVWLEGDSGDGFYYAHLDGFAKGISQGLHVDTGTVIGYVGDTGNAEGGQPHLHLEYHPVVRNRSGRVLASGVASQGPLARTLTPAVNPKPYLDELLDQAVAGAGPLVEEILKSALPTLELGAAQSSSSASTAVIDLDTARTIAARRFSDGGPAAAAAYTTGSLALLTLLAVFAAWLRIWRSPKKAGENPPVPSRGRSQLL